jgi:acyl dehydratase
MSPGDPLPLLRHEVKAAAMVPLAQILRDPNPIHLDPAATAAAGLGDRVINQGPANLAYVLNMLAAAFAAYRVEALESRFLANVRDGDLVEAGGKVVASEPGRIECEIWLNVVGAGPAVAGRAVLVPRT